MWRVDTLVRSHQALASKELRAVAVEAEQQKCSPPYDHPCTVLLQKFCSSDSWETWSYGFWSSFSFQGGCFVHHEVGQWGEGSWVLHAVGGSGHSEGECVLMYVCIYCSCIFVFICVFSDKSNNTVWCYWVYKEFCGFCIPSIRILPFSYSNIMYLLFPCNSCLVFWMLLYFHICKCSSHLFTIIILLHSIND